jgi:integrase
LVTDVLAIYAEEVVPGHARPHKTAERIATLADWWAGKTLAQVTGRVCREYAAHRKAQPWKSAKPGATGNAPRMVTDGGVRRELEDLRAAINYHRSEGYCRELIEVWLPAQGKKRERWLRRKEVALLLWTMWQAREEQVIGRGKRKGEKILTAKRPWRHLARFLLIALYTGSRAGAVTAASFKPGPGRAYIDLGTGVFHRRPEDEEETNKRRPAIPLPARLLAHLERWDRLGISKEWVVECRQARCGEVNKGFANAVKAAGLGPEVTPHILRHTCATWLMLLGADTREAAWYLGMSEKMLEERYGHFHPAYQAETRARLDGKRAPEARSVAVGGVFGANENKARAA